MFSIEVFDIIFNSLRRDTETLLACSLVSHTFAALSQKHLFNTVTLRPLHDHPHSEAAPLAIKFHRALQSAPFLATLVQRLKITERVVYDVDPSSPSSRRTNYDIALASILPLLTNLHELTFEVDDQYMDIKWGSIPLALQNSLISSMGLPGLTHLKLSRITDFPFSATRFSPSLTHMALDSVTFTQATPSAPSDYNRFDVTPRLDTLRVELGETELGMLVEIFTHPSSPVRTSHLRSMSLFQLLNYCHHPVQALLKHVSASLEELTLIPHFTWDMIMIPHNTPPMQFHALSCLRSLTMIVSIRRDGSSLPGVIELLGGLASSDIEEITLRCKCDDDSLDVQAQWTLIDQASAILGNLHSVFLRFRLNTTLLGGGTFPSSILTAEASLPRLRQKGVLRIEYSPPLQSNR